MTPAAQLNDFGQSAWLDLIGRKLIRSGGLAKMVDDAGIRGVTANPAIFEKAIAESDEYDEELGQWIERGKTPLEIYDALVIGDVQAACDALRPLFDRVNGSDGFVSLEVSPAIARETDMTFAEAKKYWAAVDRPNLFIKIPANPQGIDAIRQATAAGISVNITLIFSNTVYAQVIEAYIAGLEERVARGLPISQVHSVASFFVSRVDSAVDKLLPEDSPLRGKVAVANAKLAYQLFLQSVASPRWKALEAKGATRQRPLWASTGTKNKAYSDVLYVETLIGRDTVNTLPLATLKAFNDHGKVAETVTQGVDEARAQLKALAAAGVDLEKVCTQLTEEGLDLFANALISLLKTIQGRSLAQQAARAMKLLEKGDASFESGLAAVAGLKAGSRLWARDAALWPGDPAVAKSRLGWLDVATRMRHDAPEIASFAREAAGRFKHCLLLGMGGSSLAPDVLARVLGKREGGLDLRVLDSTAPDAVRAAVHGFDLSKTLFIVSSRSGKTAEVEAFYKHFRAEVEKAGGGNIAAPQPDATASTPYGSHFVAITDEGSPLQQMAKREGFWRTWVNPDDIGGRYSASSFFGLVPAALLGLDLGKLLDAVDEVSLASGASVPLKENLAVRLGAFVGGGARAGKDKLTFLLSTGLLPFGSWLEQLIAESTGKSGKGILPVAAEPLGTAAAYGDDRLFVSLSFATEQHDASFLAKAGRPLLQWQLPERESLAGEFLRWEIATAIAAAVLEVNPFDEPNVTESKQKTRELLTGGAAAQEPSLRVNGLSLFTSADHAQLLKKAASTTGGGESPAHWIAAHLALADAGRGYAALLAWLPPSDELVKEFRRLQGLVRDTLRLACTSGFGPRYLHSTGQLHQGGADTGVFLLLTSDGGADLPIPGEPYGFGALFAAQARGDLEVLLEHGRRALRVHVDDGDPQKILSILNEALGLLKG